MNKPERALWVGYLPKVLRARIQNRPSLQAILSNAGWLFADKILRMGVGFIVGVWITRYLGPEQFGVWNFATAFTALFGAFATLGLDGIVVRELVKHPERQNVLLGSAFGLKLIGGTVALIIATFAISLMRNGDAITQWLVVVSSVGLIFQSINVIDFYFQAKVKSKFTVYASNGAFVLMTIVKIYLLLIAAPLIAFAWASLGEAVLTAVFLLIAYRTNHLNIRDWCYDWQVARELLKNSWPLILSSLAIMIYLRIDQIMIGQMLGNKDVGIFSVAVKVSEFWYFIPLVVINSVFPTIILAKQQNNALYLQQLQKLLNLMVMLGLLIAIPITFLSDWVIETMFGEAFINAGDVLTIHVWAGVFVFLGVASGQWILTENLQQLAFYRTILGGLFNVLANYILIPKMGIKGSAIATIITQITAAYLFDITNNKTRNMFWMKTKAFFFFFRFW